MQKSWKSVAWPFLVRIPVKTGQVLFRSWSSSYISGQKEMGYDATKTLKKKRLSQLISQMRWGMNPVAFSGVRSVFVGMQFVLSLAWFWLFIFPWPYVRIDPDALSLISFDRLSACDLGPDSITLFSNGATIASTLGEIFTIWNGGITWFMVASWQVLLSSIIFSRRRLIEPIDFFRYCGPKYDCTEYWSLGETLTRKLMELLLKVSCPLWDQMYIDGSYRQPATLYESVGIC